MSKKEVKLIFTNDFLGELQAPNGNVAIGVNAGTVAPYDMVFGALGSCLYSTFLDVMKKKRIEFERFEMVITGEKRTEIPTVLKWVHIEATVYGPEKEMGVEQAFKLATEYCSVYYTISLVAEMSYKLNIK